MTAKKFNVDITAIEVPSKQSNTIAMIDYYHEMCIKLASQVAPNADSDEDADSLWSQEEEEEDEFSSMDEEEEEEEDDDNSCNFD